MVSAKKPLKKKAVKTAVKKKAAPKSARKKAAVASRKKTARKQVKPAKQAASSAKPSSDKPVKQPASVLKRNELLKRLLLKKRNEVVVGLEQQMGRRLSRETGQKIDSAMDSADQSALDMDQGIDYSLLEMKYEQYKDIADAFRKLQNNTYGLCEECGGEISIKRLEVNPLARYCIECKTRKEEIEKIQKEETRFKE
ncbi:MAG TPA: TraR/DksA C4-type zinc finger protein [Nitrospirota bacterium]|nr:TraR/DksA C4-type zinc finger protein [Nitrospirota bacterium]